MLKFTTLIVFGFFAIAPISTRKNDKNAKYLLLQDIPLFPDTFKRPIKQCEYCFCRATSWLHGQHDLFNSFNNDTNIIYPYLQMEFLQYTVGYGISLLGCGRANNIIKPNDLLRIINGTNVSFHQYPWLTLILYKNDFICGGSVISDLYVLTAAHCMKNEFLKDDLKILLGQHDNCQPNSDTVIFSVSDIIRHSEFNPETFAYDIMLMKVNMRITFNKYIKPICLPGYDYYQRFVVAKYKGKRGIIAGWGSTVENNSSSVSCTPLQATVPILGREFCPGNADTLFCAGYLDGQADSCQGDSGGPLQIKNKYNKFEVIGIISSGEGCAEIGKPGLYTDVLQALNWIFKHTSDSFCWSISAPFFNK